MSRPTGQLTAPAHARLAGPDHLRALAITFVLLFHYRLFEHPAWFDTCFSFGWTGVDLFFVLSGYLIAGQLFKEMAAKQTISLKPYFIKRFFRIIPAYAVILAIYFLIPAFKEWEALPSLWRFLTFTQNFDLDRITYRTFSHVWSLCVEEQFYLVFPFILLLVLSIKAGKKAALLLPFFFLFGFGIRLFSSYHFLEPLAGTDQFGAAWFNWMYYPTYNRLDGLLVGISLAGLWQFYPGIKALIIKNGNKLLMIGLLLISLSYYVCLEPLSFVASIFGFPLVALSYGFLLAAFISPSCFFYNVKSKVTSGIAALSYSLYLSHKGLIHLTQQLSAFFGIKKDGLVMFFISMIVCWAGALLLRYLIEKPFMHLKDRLLKKKNAIVPKQKIIAAIAK